MNEVKTSGPAPNLVPVKPEQHLGKVFKRAQGAFDPGERWIPEKLLAKGHKKGAPESFVIVRQDKKGTATMPTAIFLRDFAPAE